MKKNGWGFDVRDIDEKVRPQDDFYHYANGQWLRKNKIPDTEPRWGSFTILRYETEKKLKRLCADSSEQMIRDFYRSGMDLKERMLLGIKPINHYLRMIDNIKTKKDLLACITEFHTVGINAVWGCGVDQDLKDSDMYTVYIGQGGLGMPDRDYYLNDDAESRRVRNAYRPHVANMLRLSGMKKSLANEAADTVYRIEHRLARASMPKEDVREVEKIYNKKTPKQLARIAPEVDWKKYFSDFGAGALRIVVVCQPNFFAEVNNCLKDISLDEWRTYLKWHLVSDLSGFLSPAFVRQSFRFYGTVMMGNKKMRPLWRQVLLVVNGSLDEFVGKLYVKKYFSVETKKKTNALVDDLFTAYEARIKSLDWMSPATKKEALKKLLATVRKIGYPDKWKSYRGLKINAHDYAGNAIRASLFEHRRMMRKLGKLVNRKEWHMSPQTVNAQCNPSMNAITFPAAILQPPYFDTQSDDAVNYGAMGMTIAHEMTHNFDDWGSKFDARGGLKNWWTAEDRARFMKKTKLLVKQFNAYKVADNVSVNGTLTLGENIADLGGLSIAFDAYQLRLAKTGRKNIAGLTSEQRFFLGYTLFERENTRPEFEKMLAINDPHSPTMFRVNGPLSNLPEFYKAFDVKKGDKLYREPKDRAKIW
jgi:putative endopeptidase